MERLTQYTSDGVAESYIGESDNINIYKGGMEDKYISGRQITKLAEYEDIGLTPQEIIELRDDATELFNENKELKKHERSWKMEKCIRCGSEKFYLLPRKEGESIKDAAMVAQRCVQCNFFKRWCPKTERHFYQTSREPQSKREYVIASNKHRRDSYLEFWGRYTLDEKERDFGGYYKDFEGCERYTLEEIRNRNYPYPVFDTNTSLVKLLTESQYIIKYEDIKKIFRPITAINVDFLARKE